MHEICKGLTEDILLYGFTFSLNVRKEDHHLFTPCIPNGAKFIIKLIMPVCLTLGTKMTCWIWKLRKW